MILRNLPDRLKSVQKHAGINQREMATRLDVHYKSINNYLTGKTMPDGTVLARVCEEFKISPAWLLLGEGPVKPDDQAEFVKVEVLGELNRNRRTLAQDFLELLSRLQEIDRLDDFLMEAGESRSIAGFDKVKQIEDFEWIFLHEFLDIERKIIKLQPRHLIRRRSQKPSDALKERMSKAEKDISDLRSEIDQKYKRMEEMWFEEIDD